MTAVASLLAGHVTFQLDAVDRLFVAGYVPQLQHEGGLIRFLIDRGYRIPSPAGLGHNHDRLVSDLEAFVVEGAIPLVRFGKGESKEELARPYFTAAGQEGREGVVLVGKAQERVAGWRGFKDRSSALHSEAHPHFTYRRQSLFVDYWYFYIRDPEWGPGFIKLCPYAPYGVWAYLNGHEWAKRQLAKAGVGFVPLDNGLRSVEDVSAARHICARLGHGHVQGFLDRWLRRLPSALTAADRRRGLRYRFSIRQMELSHTAVFDRPQSGRAWFEAAIRDHLDLGRPEQVTLVVNRTVVSRGPRPTPGRFETRVVRRDVDPQILIRYKASKVKAYFKEHRALRVETTINDPNDFGVGRPLNRENWKALRAIGAATNARFLAALGEGELEAPDATTLSSVVLPSQADGLRAPGLRFGDPRVMALLAAVCSFAHVAGGITNAGLCRLMGGLWDGAYTPRKATYDLTRLRRKGFVVRVEGTQTYRLTAHGRRIACLFTKLAARVVIPTLTELEAAARPRAPAPRPLVSAWRAYEREVEGLIAASGLAA
jgi:hypothetical protein